MGGTRVVVLGATGNVGTAVVRRLVANPDVSEIVGVARRVPTARVPRVRWVAADVASDDLTGLFAAADVVVHLAWLIQPVRDEPMLHRTNVVGTRRVVEAAIAAGVPSLVYASSVGAYAHGPKDRAVTEVWPATGIPTSVYSRHKAEVEAYLDTVDPVSLRIVRLRTALVFQRAAASEIGRLFLGPLVPMRVIGRHHLPAVPDVDRLCFQVVHSDDAAAAYEAAALSDARGAFNVAADPVIDATVLAAALGARRLAMPARLVRGAAALTFAARLQPTSPGWVDLALGVPTMDTSAARRELGWRPEHDAVATLHELLAGFAARAGGATPPLTPSRGGTSVTVFPTDAVGGA